MPKVDCSELTQLLADMAFNLASRDDVHNIDNIVARMQAELPHITREDIVNAIVEVSQGEMRKQSELSAKLSQIKREARADKTLRDRIDELNEYLRSETLPEGKTPKVAGTEAVKQLRAIRDTLKKQLSGSEPVQRQHLEGQIATLQQRIDTGDIFPAVKVEPARSKELDRLVYQRARLKQQIRQKINALKPKGMWEHIAEPFNTVRALMTSFDVSAVLRQGAFIVFGRPIAGVKVLPGMFKALVSERYAYQLEQGLMERPNAPLYMRHGLYLSTLFGTEKFSQMEEAYQTRWAEHIPGVRASERAYLTFLNLLRADAFDTLTASLAKNGEVTDEESSAIASYVNAATGRGKLGTFDRASVALNTMFFSPRYVASRFQMLTLEPMWRGSWRTRGLIAIEYARFLIGLGTVYSLASVAGLKIGDDWRSSDFGKILVGRTRIDPLAGMAQITVLFGRIWTGETVSTTTGRLRAIRGEDKPYGGDDMLKVMARFLRTKLSPQFGFAADLAAGEDVIGRPVTVKTQAGRMLIPLAMRDIYEAMQEEGVPEGAALGMLGIFGVGIQTYERR